MFASSGRSLFLLTHRLLPFLPLASHKGRQAVSQGVLRRGSVFKEFQPNWRNWPGHWACAACAFVATVLRFWRTTSYSCLTSYGSWPTRFATNWLTFAAAWPTGGQVCRLLSHHQTRQPQAVSHSR